MKSIYLFLLGVMVTLFCTALIVDTYGSEFIHEYWIGRFWYGDLHKEYLTVLRVISIVTLLMIIIGVYKLGKNAKDEVEKEFKTKNDLQ